MQLEEDTYNINVNKIKLVKKNHLVSLERMEQTQDYYTKVAKKWTHFLHSGKQAKNLKVSKQNEVH